MSGVRPWDACSNNRAIAAVTSAEVTIGFMVNWSLELSQLEIWLSI